MGQKVNPHGLRVGVIKDWDSKWYAEKDFADYLVEDHEIRTYLKKRLYSAGVSKIEIERADMARTEFYSEGTIPLQTLRADIDYGFAEANTTYGKVGVKVWIYKGEVLPERAHKEGDR